MSPATIAIWTVIDAAHLALIIFAVVVLVPHVRKYIKKRTDHGRIPIIILSVIIGSCIRKETIMYFQCNSNSFATKCAYSYT